MSTAFLVFGLFVPRLTLLASYLSDNIPPNDTPFALDVVGSLIAPRLLIAYWTYTNQEHLLWTLLYVASFAAAWFGTKTVSVTTRRRRSR